MFIFIGLSCIGHVQNSESQVSDLKIYSPNENILNFTYNDWIAKWWQWNVARDSSAYNNDECGIGHTGPVWFLPDVLAGVVDRTCDIPLGKPILIPINTGTCWNDGNPQPMSDKELTPCAKEGQDPTTLNVLVNNTNIKPHRIESSLFNITIPEESYTRYDNQTGHEVECVKCPVGTFRAIADGYFIFLEPLKEGNYEVRYTYDTYDNPNPELWHAAKVTYHLRAIS